MAKPKLGSGKRFSNLSNKLASKGANNPDALAAWIGRNKYGPKKFAKLSQGGIHTMQKSGSRMMQATFAKKSK